ncbi:unnamed protein product [Ectocarpus sp. 6 AP-2014]
MHMSCTASGNLSLSDLCLLESILAWYNEDEGNVRRFVEVVKRKNGMSLRVIDWLVTNFSKVHSVVINAQSGMPVDLNRDYQKHLVAYNKKNMDPFARRNKIKISLFGEEERSSTVGQLNFFRWYYKNGINVYLNKHRDMVEHHMKENEGKHQSRARGCRFFPVKSFSGRFNMTF